MNRDGCPIWMKRDQKTGTCISDKQSLDAFQSVHALLKTDKKISEIESKMRELSEKHGELYNERYYLIKDGKKDSIEEMRVFNKLMKVDQQRTELNWAMDDLRREKGFQKRTIQSKMQNIDDEAKHTIKKIIDIDNKIQELSRYHSYSGDVGKNVEDLRIQMRVLFPASKNQYTALKKRYGVTEPKPDKITFNIRPLWYELWGEYDHESSDIMDPHYAFDLINKAGGKNQYDISELDYPRGKRIPVTIDLNVIRNKSRENKKKTDELISFIKSHEVI